MNYKCSPVFPRKCH